MQRIHTLPLVLLLTLLAMTGCAVGPRPKELTPTLPPTVPPTSTSTLTPAPAATPEPPTPTPTLPPVEGLTITKVNVRSGPGTSLPVIGILDNSIPVQIIAKDISGKWWQILFPEGPDGRGWVAMDFIRTVVTPEVPLAGPGASGNPTARVLQKLNVRSGPGTNFNTLGILNPNETVSLTGKNATGTWLQIEYPGGPGDRGWLTAAFLQLSSTADLPVLDEFGTPVAPDDGTATVTAPTPTPTVVPAPPDGDSPSSPSASVVFSPFGSRSFTYTGDVSGPQGDAEDWVQFTPYAAQPGQPAALLARLSCLGNGTLAVDLLQNGPRVPAWGSLACGDTDVQLSLPAGTPFQFHLRVNAQSGTLQYVRYSITLRALP